MRADTKHPASKNADRPRWIQIGWFVAIWVTSVLSLGIVAMLIRWAVKPG
jgi:hypothetical protein